MNRLWAAIYLGSSNGIKEVLHHIEVGGKGLAPSGRESIRRLRPAADKGLFTADIAGLFQAF
jgi:hypothetical protein